MVETFRDVVQSSEFLNLVIAVTFLMMSAIFVLAMKTSPREVSQRLVEFRKRVDNGSSKIDQLLADAFPLLKHADLLMLCGWYQDDADVEMPQTEFEFVLTNRQIDRIRSKSLSGSYKDIDKDSVYMDMVRCLKYIVYYRYLSKAMFERVTLLIKVYKEISQ